MITLPAEQTHMVMLMKRKYDSDCANVTVDIETITAPSNYNHVPKKN